MFSLLEENIWLSNEIFNHGMFFFNSEQNVLDEKSLVRNWKVSSHHFKKWLFSLTFFPDKVLFDKISQIKTKVAKKEISLLH